MDGGTETGSDSHEGPEAVVEQRRAEPPEGGHVAGTADTSYTDNPTFAAQSGRQVTDPAQGYDYIEEPGVAGVSTDGPASESP